MSEHPDLESEQKYFDAAYEWRERRRQSLGTLSDVGVDPKSLTELKHMQDEWLEAMSDPASGVAFGRIDTDDLETFYIGYEPIWDDEVNPLVISWKAPFSQSWYRATHDDPQDLRRKRQFVVDANTIDEIVDSIFDETLLAEGYVAPEFRDPLLNELERGRTGSMNDIVQTIQARQDEVMRAPLESLLVVQGGPGTGKTVVALHRAAILLYEHREQLTREGLLVVGPNQAFMRYVEQVLPTLGERAVSQLSIAALSPLRLRSLASDSEPAARLKGDVRMAEVIERAVLDREQVPDGASFEVQAAERRFSLDRGAVEDIVDQNRRAGVSHNAARDRVRDELARAFSATDRTPGPSTGAAADLERQIRTSVDFGNLAERVWPSLTAQALLQDLFTTARRLRRVTAGVLTADEASLLERTPGRKLADEAWSLADLALLDEADWLLNRHVNTYGHIIVDEAQDLSPMQLRVLSRRSLSGSMTLVGDLAQSTGAWTHDSWASVVEHLPDDMPLQEEQLLQGYRVPSQIFDYAARLLPFAAPAVAVPEAMREGPSDPRLLRVDPGAAISEAIVVTRQFAADGNSVGVILPSDMFATAQEAFTSAGVSVADGRDRVGSGVTLIPAADAKGLEFDAVVVVEPAAIVAEATMGLRILYVALTRATRHLAVVHERPLPQPLAPEGDIPAVPPDDGTDTVTTAPDETWPPTADDTPPWPPDLTASLVEQVAADLVRQATELTGRALWKDLAEAFRSRLLSEFGDVPPGPGTSEVP